MVRLMYSFWRSLCIRCFGLTLSVSSLNDEVNIVRRCMLSSVNSFLTSYSISCLSSQQNVMFSRSHMISSYILTSSSPFWFRSWLSVGMRSVCLMMSVMQYSALFTSENILLSNFKHVRTTRNWSLFVFITLRTSFTLHMFGQTFYPILSYCSKSGNFSARIYP